MTDVAEAVDWSRAAMTDGAKNSKAEDRRRVVVVPRKVIDKWWHGSWSELEIAAGGGRDGMSLLLIDAMDRASGNVAWLRESRMGGKSRESEGLRDRPLLYSQGWGRG